jgi:Domain of unknown function (DUF3850)
MKIRLKCWVENWDAIARGDKTDELRSIEDRTFSVGDVLQLERWDRRSDTAPEGGYGMILALVTHITTAAGPFGIVGIRLTTPDVPGGMARIVAMSIRPITVVGPFTDATMYNDAVSNLPDL